MSRPSPVYPSLSFSLPRGPSSRRLHTARDVPARVRDDAGNFLTLAARSWFPCFGKNVGDSTARSCSVYIYIYIYIYIYTSAYSARPRRRRRHSSSSYSFGVDVLETDSVKWIKSFSFSYDRDLRVFFLLIIVFLPRRECVGSRAEE